MSRGIRLIQSISALAGFVFLLTGLWAGPMVAAILPEGIEEHTREKVGPVPANPALSPAVLKEFGFDEAEQATYVGKKNTFTVAAWRFEEPTGAYAAFLAMRPAGAKVSPLAPISAQLPNQVWLVRGNYILRFDGYVPIEDTWIQLILHMPRLRQGALPSLPTFAPTENLVPDSTRYILGPESLAKLAPTLSPSLVGFQFSTEGIYTRHIDKDGPVELVVFSYPSPQIAQKQLEGFQNQSGLIAARSSSLITVVLKSPSPDAAQRWVTKVHYQANVSLNLSKPPDTPADFGEMILGIAKLIGILLVFCVGGGLGLALLRMRSGSRLGSLSEGTEEVTSLHLDSK